MKGGTIRHHALRILAIESKPKSAREFEGYHPHQKSPRNSWHQRLIELRAMGLVAEAGIETLKGDQPSTTFRITTLGRVALEVVEAGKVWRPEVPA